ncbi:hypothetical protein JEZ23_21120 [Pseudomonas aeruginosa]|nr:hypothetical protein [Pseudomonas aeruginosa]
MFQTNEQDNVGCIDALNDDFRGWGTVALTESHEWFFVVRGSITKGGAGAGAGAVDYSRTMISNPVSLMEYIAVHANGSEFFSVHLVRPRPGVVETSWLMEVVIQIRNVRGDYVYDLAGGDVYPNKFRYNPTLGDVLWR